VPGADAITPLKILGNGSSRPRRSFDLAPSRAGREAVRAMVARARTRGYAAQDPAWDSYPGGEGEEGVDRGFEGTGVPLDLGEQEAALDRGEEGDGEVCRVGPVWEMPGFAEVS